MAKYRNYMFAAILIAAGPLCLAAGASAGVLSTDRYYTWGIDGAALEIPEGSIITEAVLKIKNITNWDNQLSIHLVDNPPVGFVANTDHGDGDFFQDFGGLLTGAIQMVNNDLIITFSQADDENSWVRQIYDWPFDFQLAGGGTVSYTSALLELIDYAGNGTPFGIGFDGEGKTYGFDQITLTITVESFEGQPSSQEFVFSTSGETDLLAWWTMDDNAGTAVVADAGGAGLEGRARRNTNLLSLEGKVDAALAFDGANDYIELNSPAALDGLPAKDFTVTAWIYDTQTLINQGTIFSAYNNGCGFSLRTFGAEGTRRLVFDVPCTLVNADFHSALNSIQLNTWHHVAAVWHADTKTATLYIDGSKALYSIARAGNGIYRSDAANNKEIGRLPLGVQHFKGAIDDVRIYNVALSPEEIAAMYFEPFDSSELIAHWSLDETKGFVISDAATFDLVGTSQRNTATMTTTGRIGQALLMNGTSDHIQLNSPAALDDLPAKDFTVTAWIYDTQTLINQGTIFSAYNNGCGFSLRTFGAEGTRRLVFDVPCTLVNADFHSALNSIQLNTWHHVAAVWHADTKTATLYIDGSKALYSIARAGNGIYRSDAANNKEIGRLPLGVQHFKGAIDDVRIYNVALSPEEIAAMYFEPFDSSELIAHWSLDETKGFVISDAATFDLVGTSQRNTATMTTTGRIGQALLMNGTSDHIQLNSPAALDDLPAKDFTVTAWIYDTQTLINQGTIFSAYNNGCGFSLRTFGAEGTRRLVFDVPCTLVNADFHSALNSIQLNTWHHVAAVWHADTKTATLYIDGSKALYSIARAGNGIYRSDAANNKEIGRLPLGVQHFKGAIDDVRIYNVALSPEEIAAMYFEPFDSNGLIGHWSLDQTAGLTVGDTAVYASAGRSHRDVAHMTATGVSNRSMLFDGNTDYIELNSPTVLDDLPAGDFTIAAWIYDMQTLLNQGTIFSSYIGGRGFSLRTFGEAGKRCLIFDAPHTGIGADFRSVNGSIKPNTWHHVVAVWYAETRTAELYIDGYEVLYGWRQAGIGAYLSDAANNKEIGRLPLGVQHFKGAIDDLIICKVALSAADVLQLYDAYAVDTRTP